MGRFVVRGVVRGVVRARRSARGRGAGDGGRPGFLRLTDRRLFGFIGLSIVGMLN
ncbi:hypothetical protein [Streptomyces tsukubensis]|uniref:hypothetical protein n=1 Tax=Streptomyces tsukubensis TaxID=83656 RepID=UPI0015C3B71D|nr:hypothetical protein [Streptomyces tsukubensis]